MKSKLYRVDWNSDSILFGYESFIVAANNEKEARNTFPNGDNYDWDEKSYYCRYWIPKAHVDKLIVTYIGFFFVKEKKKKKTHILLEGVMVAGVLIT